jgi:hypothetical protein
MSKYRTLEEVVVDGVGVGANNEVELTEEQAAALEGKVELVDAPAAPAEEAPAEAPAEAPEAPEEAPAEAPAPAEGEDQG